MNIVEISETLKGVPKQFLIQEATRPSGRYPQYMIVAELSRRTSMEKRFAMADVQMPAQTVAEQKVTEATSPMPTPMTMAMGQTQPNMPSGMPSSEPRGQETMGMPAAVRMYEGGRIKAQDGLFTKNVNPRTRVVRSGIIEVAPREEIEGQLNRLRDIAATTRDPKVRVTTASQIKSLESQLAGLPAIPNLNMGPPTAAEVVADDAEYARAMEEFAFTDEDLINMGFSPRDDRGRSPDFDSSRASIDRNIEIIRDPKSSREQIETAQAFIEKQREETIAASQKADDVRIKEYQKRLEEAKKQQKQTTPEPTLTSETDIATTIQDARDDATEKGKKRREELKTLELPFEEKLKTPEAFQAELASMRKTDYLKQVEDANKKERDSIEKDRKQAIPLSLIEAGLNIATTASPNLLGAIAGGSKAGLKKWTGIQKDIRTAEKEATKAENALRLARDARQEGDIKAFKAYERDYNNRKQKVEEANFKAAMKTQELIAADYRLEAQIIGRLDATEITQIYANKRTEYTANVQKQIAEINRSAKTASERQKRLDDLADDLIKHERELKKRLREFGADIDIKGVGGRTENIKNAMVETQKELNEVQQTKQRLRELQNPNITSKSATGNPIKFQSSGGITAIGR